MTDVVVRPQASPELLKLVERTRGYLDARRADATRVAYARDWARFEAWCREQHLEPIPAEPGTVALYATALAETLTPGSITRAMGALAAVHVDAGFEPPTRAQAVRETLKGIRRVHGARMVGKSAVVTSDVRRMVDALPHSLIGLRDRALLVVGFAGGFRRSELVALDVEDLEEVDQGVIVTVRRSKTDQEAEGLEVGLPYGSHHETCPVRSVRDWRITAGVDAGALFRPVDRHGRLGAGRLSPAGVALVVKRAAQRIGLDPARYAGHSLRAGLVTAAVEAGVTETAILAQTRHRSLVTMRRYVRHGSIWRMNAAAQLGL